MNAKLIIIHYCNGNRTHLACSADKVNDIVKQMSESTEIEYSEVFDLFINVSLIDEIKQ